VKIEVITTGGTIDKIYFDALSEYQIGEPVIEALLQKMGVVFEFKVTPLMRKDSLELDDNDRLAIHAAVRDSKADKVLITHGTDTMANTAVMLQELTDKCIVLTGALQPAAFSNTDAIFNIGCAIGALQSKASGVYIAMNGVVFDALKVRKNRDKNCFEVAP